MWFYLNELNHQEYVKDSESNQLKDLKLNLWCALHPESLVNLYRQKANEVEVLKLNLCKH